MITSSFNEPSALAFLDQGQQKPAVILAVCPCFSFSLIASSREKGSENMRNSNSSSPSQRTFAVFLISNVLLIQLTNASEPAHLNCTSSSCSYSSHPSLSACSLIWSKFDRYNYFILTNIFVTLDNLFKPVNSGFAFFLCDLIYRATMTNTVSKFG